MDTTMTPTDAPDCIQSAPLPPPPKSPLSSPFSSGGGGMPASAGCRSAANVTTTTTTTSSVQRAIKDLLRSLLDKRVVSLVNRRAVDRTVSSDSTPYKQSTIAGTVNRPRVTCEAIKSHIFPDRFRTKYTIFIQTILVKILYFIVRSIHLMNTLFYMIKTIQYTQHLSKYNIMLFNCSNTNNDNLNDILEVSFHYNHLLLIAILFINIQNC